MVSPIALAGIFICVAALVVLMFRHYNSMFPYSWADVRIVFAILILAIIVFIVY